MSWDPATNYVEELGDLTEMEQDADPRTRAEIEARKDRVEDAAAAIEPMPDSDALEGHGDPLTDES